MATPTAYKAVAGGSKRSAQVKGTVLIVAAILAVGILTGGVYSIAHNTYHKTTKTTAATASTPDNTSPSASTEQQNLVKDGKPAVTNSVLTTHSFAGIGQYLADPSGNALYTYNKDKANTSNCAASCVANWPVYQATGDSSSLPSGTGVITRADGTKQYTYHGKPLYYYVVDQQSGGVNGNGLNGFYVATP